jgi:hypothetical protein
MMSDKGEIEREARQRITRYYEEQRKFEELLGQFVSLYEPGRLIESQRVLDAAAVKEIREAEQRLDKLRRQMDEACNRLYEAYH